MTVEKSNLKKSTVVIVGGGTAGWITACILAKSFNTLDGGINVVVIESPDIPTIGVGEGTWPTMRRTLEKIGVDEGEFIKQCQATFKQGTQFRNWKSSTSNHQYYNLFSSIFDPSEFNLAPYWMLGRAKEGQTYAEAVSSQGLLCQRGLAPKKITSRSFEAIQSYAYHLDAGEFSKFLKRHAQEVLGVQFLAANVLEAKLDQMGNLTSVVTDRGGSIHGDFFIDCTGFKALLIEGTLGVEFNELGDVLPNDRAVAMQVPYSHPDEEPNCVTLSTAQSSGWIWDIGLQNRRGVGYVYSSDFCSDDNAEKTLRRYLGANSDDVDCRVIPMRVGRRKKFWHKNCLAIGLSAAFIEPLEASAIFLIEAAANMFADLYTGDQRSLESTAKMFNRSFDFRWSRTIDFIKLHYVLSEREDAYWHAVRCPSMIPDSLKECLELWKTRPVSRYDFSDINEPFPFESYQYVLYGMEKFPHDLSQSRFRLLAEAEQRFNQVEKAKRIIADGLPSHRELLTKICQYGIPKL